MPLQSPPPPPNPRIEEDEKEKEKLEKERKEYWKYFIDHSATFMTAYPVLFLLVVAGTNKNKDSRATSEALSILTIIGLTSVFGSMLFEIGGRWYAGGAILSTIIQNVMITITISHAYHPGLEWISIIVGGLTFFLFALTHVKQSLDILGTSWAGCVTGWNYLCQLVGLVCLRLRDAWNYLCQFVGLVWLRLRDGWNYIAGVFRDIRDFCVGVWENYIRGFLQNIGTACVDGWYYLGVFFGWIRDFFQFMWALFVYFRGLCVRASNYIQQWFPAPAAVAED